MGPAGASSSTVRALSRPSQGEGVGRRGGGGGPVGLQVRLCALHCRVGLSDLQSILSTLIPPGTGESMYVL